jgi:hypothetical protein
MPPGDFFTPKDAQGIGTFYTSPSIGKVGFIGFDRQLGRF